MVGTSIVSFHEQLKIILKIWKQQIQKNVETLQKKLIHAKQKQTLPLRNTFVEYFHLLKALRVLPTETRLNVYRRSRVLAGRTRGAFYALNVCERCYWHKQIIFEVFYDIYILRFVICIILRNLLFQIPGIIFQPCECFVAKQQYYVVPRSLHLYFERFWKFRKLRFFKKYLLCFFAIYLRAHWILYSPRRLRFQNVNFATHFYTSENYAHRKRMAESVLDSGPAGNRQFVFRRKYSYSFL